MSKGMTLQKKGLAFVAVLLVLELGLAGVLVFMLIQAEKAAQYESRARDVVACVNYIFPLMARAERAAEKVVGTGKRERYREFELSTPLIESEMRSLGKYTALFPECAEQGKLVENLMERSMSEWSMMVDLHRTARYDDASALRFSPERRQHDMDLLKEFYLLQDKMAPVIKASAAANLRSQENVMKLLAFGVGGNIVLALAMSLAFVKGITSRLDVIVDNSRRLAKAQLLNAPLGQPDEIGDLDRVFHEMAVELDEAARKERSLTDNAREVICSVGEQGNFTKFNPAVKESWGYAQDELLGTNITKVVLSGGEALENALHSRPTGALDLECTLIRADGVLIDTLWSIRWSDRDRCLFCVVHDISERKRNEKLLQASEMRVRTVLESMLIGLVSVSESGVINTVNPRVEEIFGFTSDQLSGQTLSKIFPHFGTDEISKALDELRNKTDRESAVQSFHRGVELEGKNAAEGAVPVEVWVSEMMAPEGRNYLLSLMDVSARKELEASKREFINMISDDLRVPLSSVRDFLSNVAEEEKEGLTDDGRDRVRLAHDNVGRLLRLIADLLEIDNLEGGQLELNRAVINLGDVIRSSVESVRAYGEQFGVSVEHAVVSTMINADADRLERVLINLLSNACKFSPQGQVVTVAVDEEAESLTVKVIDHGRGIPASHLDLVFVPFKQVSTTDATKKGGTGLGLAICKAVIEQHGGAIGVDSVEGEGSTFWFRLPKITNDN